MAEGQRSGGAGMWPEERRRYVRVRKDVSVSYRIMGREEEDTSPAGNLGAGGLRLITQEALAPGMDLLITISVGAKGARIEVMGRVVWVGREKGEGRSEAGICFTELDGLQRENILSLIASDLPTPDGAELRRFIRIGRELRVEYRIEGSRSREWLVGHTCDLSLGGFSLMGGAAVTAGEGLVMRICLYGEREEPLEISGTSLRSAPCAGGFRTSGKFREVVPAAFERLAAYLSERVGVPPIGHFRESEGTERREGARGDRVS